MILLHLALMAEHLQTQETQLTGHNKTKSDYVTLFDERKQIRLERKSSQISSPRLFIVASYSRFMTVFAIFPHALVQA